MQSASCGQLNGSQSIRQPLKILTHSERTTFYTFALRVASLEAFITNYCSFRSVRVLELMSLIKTSYKGVTHTQIPAHQRPSSGLLFTADSQWKDGDLGQSDQGG